MKTKFNCFLLLSILLTNAHSQIKTIGDIYIGCAPTTFQFYTVAPKLSTDVWNFGSGASPSVVNTDSPIVLFSSAGVYNVTVGSYSKTITIYTKPTPAFKNLSPRQGCLPFTFSLEDTTVLQSTMSIIEHKWIFEDGSSATGNPITHTIPILEPKSFVHLFLKIEPRSCDVDLKYNTYLQMVSPPKAKLSASDTGGCKLPTTISFTNLSSASAYNTIAYAWSWKLPTPGTSSGFSLSPKTYTTIGNDVIVLKTTNQFGCSSQDSVKLNLDTVSLDFFIAPETDTICYDEPFVVAMKNYDTRFQYVLVNNPFIYYNGGAGLGAFELKLTGITSTGYYPFTYKKINLNDNSCFALHSDSILVIHNLPRFDYFASRNCKTPTIDTIIVQNIGKFVKKIMVSVTYADKYGFIVKTDTFVRTPNDSIIYDTLNWKELDSFYRKGAMKTYIGVRFYYYGTNCTKDTFNAYDNNSLFYAYLEAKKTKGCAPLTVPFELHSYASHRMDSAYWDFGDGSPVVRRKITSPWIIDTPKHVYTAAGIYRPFVVVKSQSGCIDTTNFLPITVGDSIIPALYISPRSVCATDTVRISKIGSTKFDRLFFVLDSSRSYNCAGDTTVLWRKFNHAGKQYVHTYASKNGCLTKGVDSFDVKGPIFYLDRDFKCSRRDSVLFFLRDTMQINALPFQWNFGDGTSPTSTINDSLWHKYRDTTGDFKVVVSAINPDTAQCSYTDSTTIRIRKVKAIFTQDVFCKVTDPLPFNNFPYVLDPSQSKQAGYQCLYTYTWLMDWAGVQYPTISYLNPVAVDFPRDTFNLSLVARDINGCADTMRKMVRLTTNNANFSLNKKYFCMPVDTVKIHNLSSSPFGISSCDWSIQYSVSGTRYSVIDFSTKNDTAIALNRAQIGFDTLYLRLKLTDSGNCTIAYKHDTLYFVHDIDTLFSMDSTCHNYKNEIKLSKYLPIIYNYRWYVNSNLVPNHDTNAYVFQLNSNINTPRNHQIQLHRVHKLALCVDTFSKNILVGPNPNYIITNSFDTAASKCYPALTTIQMTDLTNTNKDFIWDHIGDATYISNPSTISLRAGRDTIKGYFSSIFNCRDTITKVNIVVQPRTNLNINKSKICRGDTVVFSFTNMQDIDSINVVYGEGNGFSKSDLKDSSSLVLTHIYNQSNLLGDSVKFAYTIYAPNKTCAIAFQKTIYIKDVQARIRLDNSSASFCFDTVRMTNLSKNGDSYKWDFGDGKTDTIKNLKKHFYSFPGTYDMKLIATVDTLGCTDSTALTVTLHPIPIITAKSDSVCEGDSLTIHYTSSLNPIKIFATPDSLFKNPYSQSPIKTKILNNTQFQMIGVTNENCSDTIAIAASVIKPIYLESLDTIIESGQHVVLPVNYNSLWTYLWTPALTNPSCTNCSNPILQVIIPTRYDLSIQDYRKCFTIKAKYSIDIFPDILVKVPTAFTPNGDGVNDILYARGFGIKKLLNFKIYNRLGQLIFVTNDENFGWDGYYKNIIQNSDTYFYNYEAESFIPKKIVYGEGNFMLLR
jgi:gliding motility-associated-like protein